MQQISIAAAPEKAEGLQQSHRQRSTLPGRCTAGPTIPRYGCWPQTRTGGSLQLPWPCPGAQCHFRLGGPQHASVLSSLVSRPLSHACEAQCTRHAGLQPSAEHTATACHRSPRHHRHRLWIAPASKARLLLDGRAQAEQPECSGRSASLPAALLSTRSSSRTSVPVQGQEPWDASLSTLRALARKTSSLGTRDRCLSR